MGVFANRSNIFKYLISQKIPTKRQKNRAECPIPSARLLRDLHPGLSWMPILGVLA
jgi:hypothetical protein